MNDDPVTLNNTINDLDLVSERLKANELSKPSIASIKLGSKEVKALIYALEHNTSLSIHTVNFSGNSAIIPDEKRVSADEFEFRQGVLTARHWSDV